MPNYCANGCPFFGTPQTNNLCSACYRLAQAAAQSSSTSGSTAALTATVPPPPMHPAPVLSPPPSAASMGLGQAVEAVTKKTSVAPAPASPPPMPSPSTVVDPSPARAPETDTPAAPQPPAAAGSGSGAGAPAPPPARRPNRCAVCRKKLGLTPFECRCGQLFCAAHLASEAHDCSFDYKAHHREALARANPTVIAKKVDKI